MTMVGSRFGVVEDGFVRHIDVEHGAHDVCGFSGAHGEGDEERKNQTEDVGRIVNLEDVDGGSLR